MKKKIIVGMSGGVDSAVAALRLVEEGHNITGLFMKNWEEDDDTGECTAIADLADAQQVCKQLNIELKTVNFSAEYWDDVFENFLSEYRAGRTPNPDILCNKYIKFKAFMEYALDLGADMIATGHYAGIEYDNDRYQLKKGADSNKDQSYFLYTLSNEQLSRCLFPLGHMQKSDVRAMAETAGFENHKKKDSTGICFIGERKFRQFLQRFIPTQTGDIKTTDGRVIGSHQGLMYYTIGQRQGLGIGGVKGAPDQPWYVLAKNLKDNILMVGQGENHPLLFNDGLEASMLHWVNDMGHKRSFNCCAKTRYRQPDQSCGVEIFDGNRCRIFFDQPQRAITPGQSVVFYDNDECLGGGIIDEVLNYQHLDQAESVSR